MSLTDDHAQLRALIYCRVSQDPTGRSISVTDQERECRAYCDRQGWPVVDAVIDNDMSATRWARKDRPGYRLVRERLTRRDANVLVCWESSRQQRDLSLYVEMRELCAGLGVLWSYSGRIYDLTRTEDRFTTGLDALLDEREADKTRDRVMRGVRSRLTDGMPHGRLPYGYRAIYDPATGAPTSRVPDDVTAPVVREITARALMQEAFYSIALDLQRRGVPSPHAYRLTRIPREEQPRAWTLDMVSRISRNPTYAGLRTHKGKVIGEGKWEPLISAADHAALVEMAKGRPGPRDRRAKHLLAGLAVCGVCGSPCRRVLNRGCPSYACHGLARRGESCVSRRQDLVDELVTEFLFARLEMPDRFALLTDDDADETAHTAAGEVADLRARLAEFESSAAQGQISAEAFGRIEQRLTAELDDAQRRAIPTTTPRAAAELLTASDVRATWNMHMPMSQRRLVVAHWLEVTIHRVGRHGSKRFDPSKVEITWRV